MSISGCCVTEPRRRHMAESIASGATLLLLPKCPRCLAGWIASATGVEIPVSAAAALKVLLVMGALRTRCI